MKTMNASPLRTYVDELTDLPADVLLGRIVLFTITDEPVAHSDVVKWFTDLNLNAAHLPAQNKALHAFQKATSEAKDSYPMTKGRTAQVLCRDVTATPDYVRRQMTREIRDSKNKKLDYTGAIDCVFYRPTNPADQSTARVNVQVQNLSLEPGEIDSVKLIAEGIWQRYMRYYDFLDGQKLRATVRNYLKHLNAIEIKGGVYFVHSTKDDELARLATLVQRFGGGCHMNMIPIVDLKREREFIAQVFEREASQSLQEITREARDMLGKKVTPAAYAKLKARYDELLNNATEHMMTLQVSQDVTAASAEVAQDVLARVAEEMINS